MLSEIKASIAVFLNEVQEILAGDECEPARL